MIYYTSIVDTGPRIANRFIALDTRRAYGFPRQGSHDSEVSPRYFYVPGEQITVIDNSLSIIRNAVQQRGIDVKPDYGVMCGMGRDLVTEIHYPKAWKCLAQIDESLFVFQSPDGLYFLDADAGKLVKRSLDPETNSHPRSCSMVSAGENHRYLYLLNEETGVVSIFDREDAVSGKTGRELDPIGHIYLGGWSVMTDPAHYKAYAIPTPFNLLMTLPEKQIIKFYSEFEQLSGDFDPFPDSHGSFSIFHLEKHLLIQFIDSVLSSKHAGTTVIDELIQIRSITVPIADAVWESVPEISEVVWRIHVPVTTYDNGENRRGPWACWREMWHHQSLLRQYVCLTDYDVSELAMRIYITDNPLEMLAFLFKGPFEKEIEVIKKSAIRGYPRFPEDQLLQRIKETEYHLQPIECYYADPQEFAESVPVESIVVTEGGVDIKR